MRGGARDTEPERDVYGGVAGPTGVTKTGGGDGGARLTVAKVVVLRKASVRETTSECRDDGERVSCLPKRGRRGTSTYYGTYCDVRRAVNESADKMNGTSENPPAMRRRTHSSPSPNGG